MPAAPVSSSLSRLIRTVFLLLALSWTVAGPPPGAAHAQASPESERLLPEVRAGFDGLAKAGRWLPVRVTVANDGPGLSGEVRVIARPPSGGPSLAYAAPVELPTRSRKLVQLIAPAPDSPRDLQVDLASGDRVVADRQVPIRLLAASDFLVGVLADDDVPPAGLGALRRGGGQVSVARVGVGDLPTEPIALQALDALVIRNISSGRLDREQVAALRTWIEAGGQLVVAGGPSWRRTVEGLEDLLPVEGFWTRQVKHLRALGRYAGGSPPDGEVLLAVGSPVAGARVFLEHEGSPLVAERWLGQGRVTFLAADPSLEPFRSWPGAEGLWQRILVGGRPLFPALDESNAGAFEPQLRNVLARLMDLGLPGPGWLAAFLLVYVVCVGPLQYAVLRRIDRREWAWIGFPLLAVGFAGLAYLGGSRLRGSDVRLGAVSIVRSVHTSETASTETYVGLVAPVRRAYELHFVDGAAPRALGSTGGLATDQAVIRLGRPTVLPDLRVEGRTLQAFRSRTFGPAPTPVRADLQASGGRLEGLITNGGPERLEDVALLAAGEVHQLGDVGPGESRAVSLALPTTRASAGGSVLPPARAGASGGADQRRALLPMLLGPARGGEGEAHGGVLLLAWSGATPPRITADGQPVAGAATRLLQQTLPVQYGDEAPAIPPGLLPRTVLDGAALSRGAPPLFLARGPIVFQYDLPPEVVLGEVDRLSVHLALESRSGPGAPSATWVPPSARVSLLRWADRTWVDVPLGGVGVADVIFGGAFIDGGAIRLRLEPTGSEALVRQLDVSIQGRRTPEPVPPAGEVVDDGTAPGER